MQPNQAGHDTRPKTRPFKFTFASVDVLFAFLNMLSKFLLSLDTKMAKLVYCLVFSINLLCPQEARQVPKYMFRQSELHRLQLAEINISRPGSLGHTKTKHGRPGLWTSCDVCGHQSKSIALTALQATNHHTFPGFHPSLSTSRHTRRVRKRHPGPR